MAVRRASFRRLRGGRLCSTHAADRLVGARHGGGLRLELPPCVLARELAQDKASALADALRKAVEKGGKQEIASFSKAEDFTLIRDTIYSRTEGKYGSRAERYVNLEAGHACQNLLLQAVALDLGAVPVGAFYDDQVQAALGLPADHQPLYLVPVGHPQ